MPMTRDFLTNLGITEKDTITSIINFHKEEVEALKGTHGETLEAEKGKLQIKIDDLQTKLDNAPKGGGDGEDWKTKYESEFAAHELTKQGHAAEKDQADTAKLLREALLADGANPKAVELLLKAADISAVKKKDGKIENLADVTAPIKEQYADFFGETRREGIHNGSPPPGGDSPYTGKTATELMAEANANPGKMDEIMAQIKTLNTPKKE